MDAGHFFHSHDHHLLFNRGLRCWVYLRYLLLSTVADLRRRRHHVSIDWSALQSKEQEKEKDTSSTFCKRRGCQVGLIFDFMMFKLVVLKYKIY